MMNTQLIKSTFTLVILYFFSSPILQAQPNMQDSGFSQFLEFTGNEEDFIIPSNANGNAIDITLRGGDGGDATVGSCHSNGGDGATITTTFAIGMGEGELPPGTKIRFVIGGGGVNGVAGGGIASAFGGGGGGTAVLAKINGTWEILAVAGGGGGAFQGQFVACTDSEAGHGGRSGINGSDGNGSGNGSGGINGNGGTGGTFPTLTLAGGGGGAYTGGSPFIYGGVKGYNKGGRGGLGNDENASIDGGWGFGGGGGSNETAGGGGGYSGGGGGGSTGRGGGGGSYTSSEYNYSETITAGGASGTSIHGSAVYRFKFFCIGHITNIEETRGLCNGENDEAQIQIHGNSHQFLCFDPIYRVTNLANFLDFQISTTGLFNLDEGTYIVQLFANNLGDGSTILLDTEFYQVTQEDNTPPVAKCKDYTVVLEGDTKDYGFSDIFGEVINDGSYDNCGLSFFSASMHSFSCDDIGEHTVVLTVADNENNQSTCTCTVTVVDDEAPTLPSNELVAIIVLGDEGESVGITRADFDFTGLSDNCTDLDDLIITWEGGTTEMFDCADWSVRRNRWITIEDASGNITSTEYTLRIEDFTPPIVYCKTDTIYYTGTPFGLSQYDGYTSISDNCGSIGFQNTSFHLVTCDDVGSTLNIEVTISDGHGNTATCIALITILDELPPVANCQNTLAQLDENGEASITADDVDNNSSDNCGIASREVFPNTFDCTNIGENIVTLTVADASGNSSSCTAIVTVEDVELPSAICQNITLQLDENSTAFISTSDINNGSSDNCGIESMSVTPNTFDCSNVGDNTVTLTVIDVNGNTSTCTATVTVQDNVAPTAICQNTTVQLGETGTATINAGDINNSSSDDCGIASMSVSPNTFDCSNIGENTVTLTVTDVNGNVSTCTATVTVQDNLAPTAICQNVTVQLDENDTAFINVSDIDNGSSDNCGIASRSILSNTFDCSSVGGNTVTLTITDVNGNVSTCIATVTITDNIAPQINTPCPDDIILCGAQNVNWTPPTATDNCAIVSTTSNYNPGDYMDVGVHVVSYTFYDAGGLSASCSLTITILAKPAVTIYQGSLPQWCQGVKILNAYVENEADLQAPINYSWADNLGNTSQITALTNGTYSVTVTDDNNCSAVATLDLDVDLSTLFSAYTIIGGEVLEMAESTVLSGGVGVLDADEVSIEDNTDIATFLRSQFADIDASSTVADFINADASITLPTFRNNPYYNNSSIYVPAGGTMTLSGSNYGNVSIGYNATLIINNGTIYMKSLTANNSSAIIFNQPTNMMIKRKLRIKSYCTINVGGPATIIYSGDNASVGQGSTVEASIFAQEELEVSDSGASALTYMTGLFIGIDGVVSAENVIWSWNAGNCDIQSGSSGHSLVAPHEQEIIAEIENKEVGKFQVYPNPVEAILNIDAHISSEKPVSVEILDINGQVLYSTKHEFESSRWQLDLNALQLPSGLYLMSIRTDTGVMSKRFVKE